MTLLDRVRAAGNETPAASRATRDEMLEWLKERVREQLPADDIASLAKGNPERARNEIRAVCRAAFEGGGRFDTGLAEQEALADTLIDSMLGFGPLEPFLADESITEIMVNGPSDVFFERDGRLHRSEQRFADEGQLRALIDRVLGPLGRRIDEASPMVNARLPEGHRVHVIIPPLALDGPVMTNLLLADELNRAIPRTQSALLECMCEHQVSPDGQSRILEAPFMVIATQNPIEYQGTYPLPEAQLDRFAMRLTLGYPDEEAEREMLYDRRHIDPLESLKPEISCQEVLNLQADMKKVGMEASVSAYLLTIVQSTRRDARLTLGASPRAAIRLADCSRSLALISGREFVLPDDVRELAPLVLSHRLVVDAKTRYAGVSAQEIVAEIVQSVKVPL